MPHAIPTPALPTSRHEHAHYPERRLRSYRAPSPAFFKVPVGTSLAERSLNPGAQRQEAASSSKPLDREPFDDLLQKSASCTSCRPPENGRQALGPARFVVSCGPMRPRRCCAAKRPQGAHPELSRSGGGLFLFSARRQRKRSNAPRRDPVPEKIPPAQRASTSAPRCAPRFAPRTPFFMRQVVFSRMKHEENNDKLRTGPARPAIAKPGSRLPHRASRNEPDGEVCPQPPQRSPEEPPPRVCFSTASKKSHNGWRYDRTPPVFSSVTPRVLFFPSCLGPWRFPGCGQRPLGPRRQRDALTPPSNQHL